jgi:N-acetylmuramate 1-kinase
VTAESALPTISHVESILSHTVGPSDSHVSLLPGGASDRWFARVTGAAAERYSVPSIITMGVRPDLWEIIDAYLLNQRFLAYRGVPVAATFAVFPANGIALIEDLGDTRLLDAVSGSPGDRADLYGTTVDLLAWLHAVGPADDAPCPVWSLDFDVEKYLFEFGFHVDNWLIGAYLVASPTSAERVELDAAYRWMSEVLAAQPRVFTHRDFQSTNIMVRQDGSLALIDFQDARRGLRQYDLASLLYDSYVELAPDERSALVKRYRAASLTAASQDEREFDLLLRIAAIQRKLHDAGAFVYTAEHRGKTGYLRWVPSALSLSVSLMRDIPECARAAEILNGFMASRDDHR